VAAPARLRSIDGGQADVPKGAEGVRLVDLRPFLVRYVVEGDRILHRVVQTVAECQGIRFYCPLPGCNHQIVCWSRSRGVPEDATPGPGRWKIEGDNLGDLTLNAEAPGGARSVQLNGGCNWHGFVTKGLVTTC
jgi:hypothetical protein